MLCAVYLRCFFLLKDGKLCSSINELDCTEMLLLTGENIIFVSFCCQRFSHRGQDRVGVVGRGVEGGVGGAESPKATPTSSALT